MNDEVQAVTETATAVANVAAKPGMSTGAKVGIIGGAIAAVGAVTAGTMLFIKKRKAKKAAMTVANSAEATESK